MSKQSWLQQHLLLNLGFVPKLFGFTNEDLYRLTQGPLKQWTNGVEYYFGFTLKGVENKQEDLPPQLIHYKLINTVHAPFVREHYPFKINHSWKFAKWARSKLLTRAKPNPWERLPKIVELSSQIGVKKINIHAADIILSSYPDKLFRELNKLSNSKKIQICLENNVRTEKEQKSDSPQWTSAHNPLKLIEYLLQNNLENLKLTIDTAHLAASGYDAGDKWEKIKRFTRGNINSAIGHFHLVDFDKSDRFEAVVPGKGSIGIIFFKNLIDDLWRLNYKGTISLEVAPIDYHKNKLKLIKNALWRIINPKKNDLSKEEEYILKIIKSLL